MRSWTRARIGHAARRCEALSDSNVVHAPAFTGDAAVTSHPPAQDKLRAASRETHAAVDKSARVTGPCLPTSQRIATATVDGAIVTADNKRATGSKDVLKRLPAIEADLQHPAVEPILQVKVVAEKYLHSAGIADRCNAWRRSCLSLIVAESSTKTALGSVSAGGMGAPELEVTQVVLDQPVGSVGGVTPSKNSDRSIKMGSHCPSTR